MQQCLVALFINEATQVRGVQTGPALGIKLFHRLVMKKNFKNFFWNQETFSLYTQQKKLRKSQKTMQHKNTKANKYSIFIYLFRYMSSVGKNV